MFGCANCGSAMNYPRKIVKQNATTCPKCGAKTFRERTPKGSAMQNMGVTEWLTCEQPKSKKAPVS